MLSFPFLFLYLPICLSIPSTLSTHRLNPIPEKKTLYSWNHPRVNSKTKEHDLQEILAQSPKDLILIEIIVNKIQAPGIYDLECMYEMRHTTKEPFIIEFYSKMYKKLFTKYLAQHFTSGVYNIFYGVSTSNKVHQLQDYINSRSQLEFWEFKSILDCTTNESILNTAIRKLLNPDATHLNLIMVKLPFKESLHNLLFDVILLQIKRRRILTNEHKSRYLSIRSFNLMRKLLGQIYILNLYQFQRFLRQFLFLKVPYTSKEYTLVTKKFIKYTHGLNSLDEQYQTIKASLHFIDKFEKLGFIKDMLKKRLDIIYSFLIPQDFAESIHFI